MSDEEMVHPLVDAHLKEAVGRIEDVLMASLDWKVLIEVLADEVLRAGIFRSLTIALLNWEEGYAEIVGNYLAVDRSGKINPDSRDETIYLEESDAADKVDPFDQPLDGHRIALDDRDDFTIQSALSGSVVVQGFIENPQDHRRKVKMGYFIPLRCGGRVAAVLSTGSSPADQEEMIRRIEAMQPLFKQVALALEHARLHRTLELRHQALQQRDRIVAALQHIQRSLLSSLDREEILDSLVREVVTAGIFESLTVATIDRSAHRVDVVRSVTCQMQDGRAIPKAISKVLDLSYDLDDANITAEVARSGTMVALDEWDSRYDKRVDSPAARRGRTAYFIPIKRGDTTVAVLATGSRMADKAAMLERLETLQPLFDMLALALVHASLYQSLSEQSQRLEITLESIGDGVVATDQGGHIVAGNDPFRAMAEVGAGQLLGRELQEVLAIGEDAQRSVAELMDCVLGDGRRKTALIERLAVEGKTQVLRLDGAPICSDSGLVEGGVFVVHDVTVERAREEERQRVERIESLGQLAGGIAHDFNNMLSSAAINSSLLKMVTDDGRRGEIADDIDRALVRARDLTSQLMGFMRSGELVRKRASLEELVRESSIFVLRGSNIRLEVEVERNLWSIDVDATQISRVVHNLILNAQQAMASGGTIRVEMRNVECEEGQHPSLAAGQYVSCSVRDTGVGIGKTELERIFDPYFTTKGDGMGLGLSSSYAIINRHGGALTVSSTLGQGAEFCFYLPRGQSPLGSESGAVVHSSVGARVLLLDDDEDLCAAVRRSREHIGYDVLATSSEQEALLRYRSAWSEGNPFNVAILDLTIPGGKGGVVLAGELRQTNPQARIVLSTGYVQSPDVVNYRALGFVACLAKPYTISEFKSVVEQALSSP